MLGVLLLLPLLLSPCDASASPPQPDSELPNFDQRTDINAQPAAPSLDHRAALANLKTRLPDAQVDFDELLGSPKWISSPHGFLTGPNGSGGGISTKALSEFSSTDSNRVTKAFLREHSALFGHGPEALNAARVKREFVAAHNGLRTVVWEQQVDGIPVFEALLISHLTQKRELVNIASHFLPDPEQAADVGATNRGTPKAKPSLTAPQAIAIAAQAIGVTVAANQVLPLSAAPGPEQHQTFKAAPLKRTIDAHLVWLPMSRNSLRLCWEIILISRERNEMFRLLIDAQNGTILIRQSLTERISDASWRVFNSESPSPLMPGYSSPSTNQPPQIPRVLVVTNALYTNASPNGWISDGNNLTQGNNVDAYLDPDGDDYADAPRPAGSPFRVFDFPLDLTQDPVSYSNACVVNLFYWNNWMHDKLYALGFTEAAGNYQMTNFGRGGLGNDPIEAEAQFGSAAGQFNGSSFFVTPDGMPGIMQISIYNGSTPALDGDFDTEVILHEYAHGFTNRRVGGGAGISPVHQSQSLGLAEGWSDFYSIALLTQPGENVNGCYPESAYAAHQLYGLTQNYYFGFRRYPYSTDMTKSPQTFKDIDPNQASSHSGIPLNPITSIINAPINDPHNQGEIWCVTLWDARANLINKYGFNTGNQLILQLVTDGMNLAPANPTFTQARDAIIQADIVDNGALNYHELWQAFAKRGLGAQATAPVFSTTSGVVESYATPDDLLIRPSAGLAASGAITGPFTPPSQTCLLENTYTNVLNWAATATVPWVSLSITNGTLTGEGALTNLVVSLNFAASNLAVGTYTGIVIVTNLNSGVSQTQNISLNVTEPVVYSFSLSTDPGWPRQGQWAFGQPAGQGGTSQSNPDPASGATGTNVFGVNLNGDYSTAAGGPYYLTAGPLDFTGLGDATLQFKRWLNTDSSPYAFATIDVSNDGTNWTSVFVNGSTPIKDSSWNLEQYDISGVADNQSTVYVRWGYQVAAGAFAYSGWNLDDITFLGLSQLSVSLPSSATKGQGLLAGQGNVSIAKPLAVNLNISLSSSDSSEVVVPTNVTILAGQTNAVFDLNIVDNHLLNGTESVAIVAAALGDSSGTGFITIFDNETAVLTLTLPATANQGDGQIQGTVTSSAAPARDISVSFASSATACLQVPPIVVIPAGQISADFYATVINTNFIGNWPATVTAHVLNWTDGQAVVNIQYGQNTNLLLTLPAQASESNGSLTNAGLVQIAGILPTNLVVTLGSGAASKLTVPPTATIPAGQTSAAFNLTLIAGNPPYSPLSVLVSASAPGFVGNSANINVIDDQTPPAPYNPMPLNFSTISPINPQLSWSSGLGEGVEFAVNGGFESGDFTGWVTPSGTNTAFGINDGTIYPPSQDAPTTPFAGVFSALADQSPPAVSMLYQDITLPTNVNSIILSWVDRIRNFYSDFATNQQFSVEVCDTNNVPLAVVFSTQPGGPLLNDWTQRSADISSFSGQTIRLEFIVNAGLSYLDVHLDEISVRCASLPQTTYDVYFGTNPVPDGSEFLGSTTNTYWELPQLTPQATYYWQIIARRANQTAGLVWQFSTLPLLFINSVALAETAAGTTNAVFTVSLSDVNNQTVMVDFSTTDGTALAPNDYVPTNGTLVFNPGETNQIITVAINLNTNSPPPRKFFLNLSNPVNAALGSTQGIGALLNSISPPILAPVTSQTVYTRTAVSFTANTTNTNNPNDVLTFSLDPGAPAGAIINSSTGLFTWTNTDASIGTNVITVRVTDSDAPSLTAVQMFTIVVVPPPTINSIQISSGQATIAWTAIPGRTYRVQSSDSLTGVWNNLPGNVTASGSIAAKTDLSTLAAQRFYRVMVLP